MIILQTLAAQPLLLLLAVAITTVICAGRGI